MQDVNNFHPPLSMIVHEPAIHQKTVESKLITFIWTLKAKNEIIIVVFRAIHIRLAERDPQVADKMSPLVRCYQVIIRKTWSWSMVVDICKEYHASKKGRKLMPLQKLQWQSKTVALLCPTPTPLSIILIIVEVVLVLNMQEIYFTGR